MNGRVRDNGPLCAPGHRCSARRGRVDDVQRGWADGTVRRSAARAQLGRALRRPCNRRLRPPGARKRSPRWPQPARRLPGIGSTLDRDGDPASACSPSRLGRSASVLATAASAKQVSQRPSRDTCFRSFLPPGGRQLAISATWVPREGGTPPITATMPSQERKRECSGRDRGTRCRVKVPDFDSIGPLGWRGRCLGCELRSRG